MLGKRKIRQYVFELLCGYECNSDIAPEEYYLTAYDNLLCSDDENDTVKNTFLGVLSNIIRIDEIITSYLNNWKVSRLSVVTRTILRLSTYEMIYLKLAPAISINEAVEISKKFAEDKAPGYINGVLNNISANLSKYE
ncbi:MAG: transcription antitermination factor NusB [Clostridia bacterium]|nr:transcription antitermination factor NusB [Clostridia bacterium]